jgi:hypothetical protein
MPPRPSRRSSGLAMLSSALAKSRGKPKRCFRASQGDGRWRGPRAANRPPAGDRPGPPGHGRKAPGRAGAAEVSTEADIGREKRSRRMRRAIAQLELEERQAIERRLSDGEAKSARLAAELSELEAKSRGARRRWPTCSPARRRCAPSGGSRKRRWRRRMRTLRAGRGRAGQAEAATARACRRVGKRPCS